GKSGASRVRPLAQGSFGKGRSQRANPRPVHKTQGGRTGGVKQIRSGFTCGLGRLATTSDGFGGPGADFWVHSHELDLSPEDCSAPRTTRRKPRHYRAAGEVGLAWNACRRRGP